jgi:hypothetical protein
VLVADFTAIDGLWVALSVLCILVGITLAVLFLRLAGTAARLTRLLKGVEESVVPLLTKTGGTVDRVNLQLDKVDVVTDSAVSAADSLDTAVRAVSLAITRPVQKLSGLAKGVSHGFSAFSADRDWRGALAAGRDAARRREQEIAAELAERQRLPAPGAADTRAGGAAVASAGRSRAAAADDGDGEPMPWEEPA